MPTAPPPNNSAQFPPTRWSLILSVNGSNGSRSHHALNELCRIYWYPVYAFFRAWGKRPDDAEDLTQAFFFSLVSNNALQHTHPDKGRFRSFVIKAAKNFVINDNRRASAHVRGGDVPHVPFDAGDAEKRYQFEPVDHVTPENLFERRMALELMQTALTQLESEFSKKRKKHDFAALSPFLSRSPTPADYDQICEKLEIPANTARSRVHRMRKRFHQLISDEVAQVVSSPEEVEAELQHLLAVLERTGKVDLVEPDEH